MIVDVILGVNVDTPSWISKLEENEVDHIVVIDYTFLGNIEERSGIAYLSPVYAVDYLKNFDTINYYKSLYAYPGMSGKMAWFFKRNEEV